MKLSRRAIIAGGVEGVGFRPQAESERVLAIQALANQDGRFRKMQRLLRAYANTLDNLFRKLLDKLFTD